MAELWWWITGLAVAALFGGLALFSSGRRSGVAWRRILGVILMVFGFVYAFLLWLEGLPTG